MKHAIYWRARSLVTSRPFFTSSRLHVKIPPSPPSPKPPSGRPPHATSISKAIRYVSGVALFMVALAAPVHLFMEYVGWYRFTYGPSMYPTIAVNGETVIVSHLHRRGKGVEVGDIVSFKHPVRRGFTAMKRVVGMPGDFVLRDTPRSYGTEREEGYQPIMIQVPEGHCWVTGDNLEWSRDSRHFGPLPLALIRGKVISGKKLHSFTDWRWLNKGLSDFDSTT